MKLFLSIIFLYLHFHFSLVSKKNKEKINPFLSKSVFRLGNEFEMI